MGLLLNQTVDHQESATVVERVNGLMVAPVDVRLAAHEEARELRGLLLERVDVRRVCRVVRFALLSTLHSSK